MPARLDSHDFSITVAADHPAFVGHFPGHPVLPGVVLLAEVLAGVERCLGLPMDRIMIRVAKFHAPVAPGATLAVELVQGNGIAFTVSRDGTRVASGTIAVDESGVNGTTLTGTLSGAHAAGSAATDPSGDPR
jgi:3-hydroxymyristoyl/3-hydroxydecanoyl-(acyl carrier protein) dehydratase